MRASEVIQRFSEDTLALHHDIVMAEKERKASEAKTTITILTASILIRNYSAPPQHKIVNGTR